MQILFLTSARFPTQKAYGYQIVKKCESLAKLDHQVTLLFPALAPRQAKSMCTQENPDVQSYYRVNKIFDVQAARTLPLIDRFYQNTQYSWIWPWLKIMAFSLQSGILVRRYRRAERVTIWTRDFYTIVVLQLGGWLHPGDLLVYECHGLPQRMMSIFKPILRRISKILVVTAEIKTELHGMGVGAEKILVISSGVDQAAFQIDANKEDCRHRTQLPSSNRIIGYVGKFQTFDLEKGIDNLIRCFVHIPAAYNPLLLFVGGPLDHVEDYYRIADGLGIRRKSLRFVDFQSREEIPYWIKSCDVCVIPSPVKKFFSDYSSPVKMFEYMAAGVPIVASTLPSIQDVIRDGENGVLVIPDDPRSLATGITRVLSDQVFAESISRNGLRDVERYSFDTIARKSLDFILSTP